MHERSTVVVFAGGGTGGHLYPALALAEALAALRPDVRPVFLGAERGIEARILPARGVEHRLLPVRGIARGGGLATKLGVVPALARSLASAARWMRALRPELVVVTGGYAGAPAGLVAVLFRIPLVLQEQNSIPGVVTRALARFARRVHVAFPEAVDRLPVGARSRAVVSGNPIRPPADLEAGAAREALGLDPALPLVLVVGGSQGSAALNRAVLEALGARAARSGGAPRYQWLWSTGRSHEEGVREALEALGPHAGVHVRGYIDDMPTALAAASVAVSRAGAMATSEFLAIGLPAILVPLPSAAADHQTRNAEALAEAGAALCLGEARLDGAALLEAVETLVADRGARDAMSGAARERGRPEAAAAIARDLAGFLPPQPEAS